MKRVWALGAAAVMWTAAAWAQADEAAPDEEFVPWTGDAVAPAPAPPAGVKAAPAPVPPPSAPEPKKEQKQGARSETQGNSVAPPAEAAPAGESPAAPDEEWGAAPGTPSGQVPATSEPPPPPAAEELLPAPPPPPERRDDASRRAASVVRRPSPQDFNRTSLYGGLALGQWNRAVGFYLGFPLVGLKAGIGLSDKLDVGLGFDSFYGAMNEPRAFVKYQFAGDGHWSVAAQLEGGMAFFTQDPQSDPRGPRWLTGRRNYNIEPGFVASYQGDSVQSARLFLDARYHLALDTQPFSTDPLGGVPPPVVPGHNVNIRMGAEMPFSPSTSFLFIFGFDIHTRVPLDSPFMPVVSVGLVTGV